MATLEECVDGLEQLIGACMARTESLRFDITEPQHAAAVALLGTVLELAHDLVPLLRRRSSAMPKVVLRSLLEAYVDLRNVTSSADYLKHLQAAQLEQDARAFRESRRPEAGANPYFRSFLALGKEAEDRAVEIEAELGDLKDQGYNVLKVHERFERAGELERYTIVYYLLCQDSHHTLKALERRHLTLEEGRPGIVFFALEDIDRLLAEADAVAGIVANAVADASRLLDGEVRDLGQVGERLESFRQMARTLLAHQGAEEVGAAALL